MAKKTNKTNHVLNLLSNGVKKEEETAQQTLTAENAAENSNQPELTAQTVNISADTAQILTSGEKTEEKEGQKPAQETASPASTVSVVKNEKDDVAEQIRKSLEQEFETEQENERKAAFEQDLLAHIEEKETELSEEAQSKNTNAEKEKECSEDFIIVNIMERLVKDKLLFYMNKFGCCTCPRCVADATALALSGLPSRYVVINKNAVSPLLNFYSGRYAGQITVEITKACIKVQEAPRH